jgi:hypothetical protein
VFAFSAHAARELEVLDRGQEAECGEHRDGGVPVRDLGIGLGDDRSADLGVVR